MSPEAAQSEESQNRSRDIRRSIADLRALVNSQVIRRSPGDDRPIRAGREVELDIDWNDHSRARRLECHGWVKDAHHDAGEGYYATLTDVGAALIRYYWSAHENRELNELLEPEQGGGVDVFCDVALANEHP